MLRLANKSDEVLIKLIHKESKNEIGSFNLFFIWDLFLGGKSTYKYYVYDGQGFVRFGYSKKYKTNIIYDIGVLKSSRGKGIGKEIIKKLPKPILLKCNNDNISGNAFYKKIGMHFIGTEISKNKSKIFNIWIM